MSITLRPLSVSDVQCLHALLNHPEIMRALHMPATSLADWEVAIAAADPDEEHYLLTDRNTPVGWIKLNGLQDKPDAWVSMLVIAPDHQRHGYGTAALMLAEDLLRTRGYRTLRIHTNEDNLAARGCYEQHGYRQTERTPCTDGDGAARIGYTYRKTLTPDNDSIRSYWYAYAYDKLENNTDDAACLLRLLGDTGGRALRILEPCTGGGRLLKPLADAGHTVTGFDRDEDMLSYIAGRKPRDAVWYRADALALKHSWGDGYDAVVLGCNLLLNIENADDYTSAQKAFIRKAYGALRDGGRLYLDFNLFAHPERAFTSDTPREVFRITDDHGVRGVYRILRTTYDLACQICVSICETALTYPDGTVHTHQAARYKHIPTLADVHTWLHDAGFTVEREYGGYDLRPISEDTTRAVIVADCT
jgi:RimJ/RimL family protein N-acetyltransferase/SAM-dependent methyltransferase